MSVTFMYSENVTFRHLRGRVIVMGLFALSWFMQSARAVLADHKPISDAAWSSLGYSIALSPLIAVAAWVLWKVMFKSERGLFAFSLAASTAMYSAYVLIVGR